jgi:hypothetical protein
MLVANQAKPCRKQTFSGVVTSKHDVQGDSLRNNFTPSRITHWSIHVVGFYRGVESGKR